MSVELLEKPDKKIPNIEFYKPTFSKEELKFVLDCLVEDHLYTGTIVERFEKDFKSTFKIKHTISLNSLTSAYHLALLSLNIQENDPILLSTFAPHAALDAIFLIRANPIVVDLDKNSFQMDKEDFEKKIVQFNPKVLLFDHSFGSVINIKDYLVKDIPVIENFSEVIGSDPEGIQIGKQGIINICGFSENQIITTGNGSIICTTESSIVEKIRSFKYSHGSDRTDKFPKFDYNLIDYQAAMGIEQLSKLGIIIERKRKIAQVYMQSVLSASHETYFKNPAIDSFNRFPLVVSKSYDEVKRYFNSLHIGTEKTTPKPIHRILELPNLDYPNAERLYQRGHCIPIYPNLTKDNIHRIANSIKGIY